MATAMNIDVNQKLQNTNKSIVTPNHLNFGERVRISANGTPIKTFANHLFSSIDPTIFSKAKLQFNVPTIQVNYPIHFKPKVSYNVSPYKFGSNIPSENIPTYIYCDTITDLNKNEATYIVNLESNFFTISPLSTSPADLLSPFLKEIKKNKDKCFVDGRNFI
jgi:hypothetical protein